MEMKTKYMGLELSSPLVPSSSPLSEDIDVVKRMEDSGAGAVVLWSLFEEQIAHDAAELDHYLHYGAERFAESLTYFPEEPEYHLGPEKYLDHIRKTKEAVDIPVIASLNGVSAGGWTEYAQKMEQAGADALELNVYYIPTNPDLPGEHVEKVHMMILETVKSSVSIPVAMKLSPYFSSTAKMLKKLDDGGADALVLFNRFYQPDIDVENLEVKPSLSLSSPFEMRLPLRWIAIMRGQVKASLAATSGIYTAEDVAKVILAGADVAMMCSALLRNGVTYMSKVLDELKEIMDRREYESIEQMKGVMSQQKVAEPGAFERANYMKTLQSYRRTSTME
ncbi:MAG: dihydroorotate dehydrogenase-like protein [Phycisphaerae bacterium]